MIRIIAGAAISHSPLMNVPPRPDETQMLDRYKESVAALGRQIQALDPDVIVVLGQDHFRTLFYDLMPPIAIGVGALSGWGDWGTRKGALPNDAQLARHLHRDLLEQGFDIACSHDLVVDHGITQPMELLGLSDSLPIIPILINTSAPPLISPARSYQLGVALAQALAKFGEKRRVVVLGSGGLSHSPPAVDIHSIDPAQQEAVQLLIHGRAQVEKNEEGRQQRLVAAVQAGRFAGSVRPEWDRRLLRHFASASVMRLAEELTEASIEKEGGCGGQEIRTWLALAGVFDGQAATEICYFPIESLITGMGCIAYGLTENAQALTA